MAYSGLPSCTGLVHMQWNVRRNDGQTDWHQSEQSVHLCHIYTVEVTQGNDAQFDFYTNHLSSPYSVPDGAHGAEPFTSGIPFYLFKKPAD